MPRPLLYWNARPSRSTAANGNERVRPSRRPSYHDGPHSRNPATSLLSQHKHAPTFPSHGHLPSLWTPASIRRQVLQRLRHPTAMSVLRNSIVGQELLPQLWPKPQTITDTYGIVSAASNRVASKFSHSFADPRSSKLEHFSLLLARGMKLAGGLLTLPLILLFLFMFPFDPVFFLGTPEFSISFWLALVGGLLFVAGKLTVLSDPWFAWRFDAPEGEKAKPEDSTEKDSQSMT
jgi:hypothetical protein